MRISGKTLFTLLILLGVMTILYMTMQLGRVARMVPLWVVIPTAVLLVYQSVQDIFVVPHLQGSPLEKATSSDDAGSRSQLRSSGGETKQIGGNGSTRGNELRVILWLLLGFVSIYMFGFVVTAPIYIFLVFRLRAREGLLMSFLCAAGVLGITFGILNLLMPARIMEGLFWRWIGV